MPGRLVPGPTSPNANAFLSSCVQLMRAHAIRFETNWFLYLRSRDARATLHEDLALLETLDEKWGVSVSMKSASMVAHRTQWMLKDVVEWIQNPVTGNPPS